MEFNVKAGCAEIIIDLKTNELIKGSNYLTVIKDSPLI